MSELQKSVDKKKKGKEKANAPKPPETRVSIHDKEAMKKLSPGLRQNPAYVYNPDAKENYAPKSKGSSGSESESDDKSILGESFIEGQKAYSDIMGPEGLRTKDMADVMERRKKQADEGISPVEQEAMRSKLAQDMMKAEQMAGLKLGGALGGMRGQGAAAQARSLQAQGMQARAGIERDIFMAQQQAKREGVDKLEDTTRFDVGQIGKEKALESALGLGFEQITATKEGAALAAEAMKKSGGGGKK